MNTQRNLPKFLFIILLAVMTLPLVFSLVPASRGRALFGVTESEIIEGNIWRFLDQTFQRDAEQQFKHKVGFCNHAVRVNNELNYRLFHYSSAPKLVLGQEDYFYEDIYLNEYAGKDYVGETTIINNVKRFKHLQDSLKQEGKHLLLIIEPSKARVVPEHLPSRCHKGKHTNYESYVKVCQQYGVQYLDLNQYFEKQRDNVPHALYTKHGIHWSSYGTWFAATAIQQFIEQQTQCDLGQVKHLGDTLCSHNDNDFDLEPPMNLLRPLPHEQIYVPVLEFQSAQHQTDAVIIADSYVWSLWEKGFLRNWFKSPDFWYYNQTVYPNIWAPNDEKVTDDLRTRVMAEKEVILLMMTTPNLKDFGWGITN